MTIKQLTVFVGNRRGALADVTGLLAEKGVDLRALSIADTRDFGILRLIVSDTKKPKRFSLKTTIWCGSPRCWA